MSNTNINLNKVDSILNNFNISSSFTNKRIQITAHSEQQDDYNLTFPKTAPVTGQTLFYDDEEKALIWNDIDHITDGACITLNCMQSENDNYSALSWSDDITTSGIAEGTPYNNRSWKVGDTLVNYAQTENGTFTINTSGFKFNIIENEYGTEMYNDNFVSVSRQDLGFNIVENQLLIHWDTQYIYATGIDTYNDGWCKKLVGEAFEYSTLSIVSREEQIYYYHDGTGGRHTKYLWDFENTRWIAYVRTYPSQWSVQIYVPDQPGVVGADSKTPPSASVTDWTMVSQQPPDVVGHGDPEPTINIINCQVKVEIDKNGGNVYDTILNQDIGTKYVRVNSTDNIRGLRITTNNNIDIPFSNVVAEEGIMVKSSLYGVDNTWSISPNGVANFKGNTTNSLNVNNQFFVNENTIQSTFDTTLYPVPFNSYQGHYNSYNNSTSGDSYNNILIPLSNGFIWSFQDDDPTDPDQIQESEFISNSSFIEWTDNTLGSAVNCFCAAPHTGTQAGFYTDAGYLGYTDPQNNLGPVGKCFEIAGLNNIYKNYYYSTNFQGYIYALPYEGYRILRMELISQDIGNTPTYANVNLNPTFVGPEFSGEYTKFKEYITYYNTFNTTYIFGFSYDNDDGRVFRYNTYDDTYQWLGNYGEYAGVKFGKKLHYQSVQQNYNNAFFLPVESNIIYKFDVLTQQMSEYQSIPISGTYDAKFIQDTSGFTYCFPSDGSPIIIISQLFFDGSVTFTTVDVDRSLYVIDTIKTAGGEVLLFQSNGLPTLKFIPETNEIYTTVGNDDNSLTSIQSYEQDTSIIRIPQNSGNFSILVPNGKEPTSNDVGVLINSNAAITGELNGNNWYIRPDGSSNLSVELLDNITVTNLTSTNATITNLDCDNMSGESLTIRPDKFVLDCDDTTIMGDSVYLSASDSGKTCGLLLENFWNAGQEYSQLYGKDGTTITMSSTASDVTTNVFFSDIYSDEVVYMAGTDYYLPSNTLDPAARAEPMEPSWATYHPTNDTWNYQKYFYKGKQEFFWSNLYILKLPRAVADGTLPNPIGGSGTYSEAENPGNCNFYYYQGVASNPDGNTSAGAGRVWRRPPGDMNFNYGNIGNESILAPDHSEVLFIYPNSDMVGYFTVRPGDIMEFQLDYTSENIGNDDAFKVYFIDEDGNQVLIYQGDGVGASNRFDMNPFVGNYKTLCFENNALGNYIRSDGFLLNYSYDRASSNVVLNGDIWVFNNNQVSFGFEGAQSGGACSINTELAVNGPSFFYGTMYIYGDLYVQGGLSLGTDLYVANDVVADGDVLYKGESIDLEPPPTSAWEEFMEVFSMVWESVAWVVNQVIVPVPMPGLPPFIGDLIDTRARTRATMDKSRYHRVSDLNNNI
eukprot:Pgem_evm15s8721